MRVASGTSSRINSMGGMWKPSSKSSRASVLRMRPPMSGTWLVVAPKPTMRPPWKTGRTTEMSFKCPVPIQGLFVT